MFTTAGPTEEKASKIFDWQKVFFTIRKSVDICHLDKPFRQFEDNSSIEHRDHRGRYQRAILHNRYIPVECDDRTTVK